MGKGNLKAGQGMKSGGGRKEIRDRRLGHGQEAALRVNPREQPILNAFLVQRRAEVPQYGHCSRSWIGGADFHIPFVCPGTIGVSRNLNA